MKEKHEEKKTNRQYDEMLAAAKGKLADRDPKDIALKSGLEYDEEKGEFRFSLLGKESVIPYPVYTLEPDQGMWLTLSVLQYMDEADGTPLAGRFISMAEFKEGGLVRGSSFDKGNEETIRKAFANAELEDLKRAALSMGGELLETKADLSVRFDLLPKYPMLLNLWLADEDFPATGKILFDANAEHYLRVEAAGTLAALLLEELVRRI